MQLAVPRGSRHCHGLKDEAGRSVSLGHVDFGEGEGGESGAPAR